MPRANGPRSANESDRAGPNRARFASTLGLLLILATACSGTDAQTNSFSTLDEARTAGAIANRWIPDGLPPGAHDIREGHVPRTLQRWGLLDFPRAEESALRSLLQPEEIPLDGLHCAVPGRIEWWPVILRGTLDGKRIAATQLRAYRSKQGDLIFAVNWKQGRAYFWTPPAH
jgi:hypothetical protein